MSSADPTVLINSNYGNLSALLSSQQTLFHNQSYHTTNIFAVDNTQSFNPVGQQGDFGREDRFRIRKRGGRVHKCWLKLTISGATLAAGQEAAYGDDLANLIVQNAALEYASKVLHEFNGEALKMYNRLLHHDIDREHFNAMALAGLPPGGNAVNGPEASRRDFLQTGGVLYVPLTWFWFYKSTDYCLTPEALASELDLIIRYRPVREVTYARVTADGSVSVAPFTVDPEITKSQLFTQIIHVPDPEKNLHLASFETAQGQIFKILDFESQTNMTMPADAGVPSTYAFKLDNIRLDSQFLMFMVRSADINVPYSRDRMQSDTTESLLASGNPSTTNALQPIISFRMLANGREIQGSVTDLENRSVHRDIYFKGTKVAEPIYFQPWGWLLKDCRNVTGFQNMTNLGNKELEIVMPGAAFTSPASHARVGASIVDVYSVSHNIIQQKQGDIIRALR